MSTSLGVFITMDGVILNRRLPQLPVKILLFSKVCRVGRNKSSIRLASFPFAS